MTAAIPGIKKLGVVYTRHMPGIYHTMGIFRVYGVQLGSAWCYIYSNLQCLLPAFNANSMAIERQPAALAVRSLRSPGRCVRSRLLAPGPRICAPAVR